MRPRSRRTAVALAVVLAGGILVACPPSSTDIHTAEMMFDLSEALNGLRQDNAVLQDQIDSLRAAVARQDTVIERIVRYSGAGR